MIGTRILVISTAFFGGLLLFDKLVDFGGPILYDPDLVLFSVLKIGFAIIRFKWSLFGVSIHLD